MTVKAKALAHRDTCESLTIHPHAGSDPRGAKGAEAPPPPPLQVNEMQNTYFDKNTSK